ncbi:hypothetical protein A8M77_23240 [Variovorax sp. JS1663]|nr:hypothetical protein A8M77_23240 [Variovorax sp. JS1663]
MYGCVIRMEGEISAGDAERLGAVLAKRPVTGYYNILFLDSPGGSVQAALELAGVVRRALLQTSTMRLTNSKVESSKVENLTCVSSCFLVWAAGVERSTMNVEAGGRHFGIGLHRPYFSAATYSNESPDRIAAMQRQAMQSVSEYLRGEQVPQALIDKMIDHASSQVFWPTMDEGFALSGRRPWFDEMMIARCNYDPTYVAQTTQWVNALIIDLAQAKGKRTLEQAGGARYEQYIQRTRKYNACEGGAKSQAQAAFQKLEIQPLPPAGTTAAAPVSPQVQPELPAPPVPEFKDVDSRLAYLRWLGTQSERLNVTIPDWPAPTRIEFLQTVWYEARRAGLDTSLVLAVIELQSSFRKYFVMEGSGSRGYMGVNPSWTGKLGDSNSALLFHMQTNMRYGCVILRHYLDKHRGNTAAALVAYYSDSHAIPTSVARARQFPAQVFAAQKKWIYVNDVASTSNSKE